MKSSAIIVAAGSGRRMAQNTPKQFLDLMGKPVVFHTLAAFESVSEVSEIVLLVPGDWAEHVRAEIVARYGLKKVSYVLAGGRERQDSVYLGLQRTDQSCAIVIIHDGVRPLVSGALIEAVVAAAADYGAAAAAIPSADTLKQVKPDGKIERTISRDGLWQAQTPQAFRREIITEAVESARRAGFYGTDDASLVEKAGHPVVVVPGSPFNLKITAPEDLRLAEMFLKLRSAG